MRLLTTILTLAAVAFTAAATPDSKDIPTRLILDTDNHDTASEPFVLFYTYPNTSTTCDVSGSSGTELYDGDCVTVPAYSKVLGTSTDDCQAFLKVGSNCTDVADAGQIAMNNCTAIREVQTLSVRCNSSTERRAAKEKASKRDTLEARSIPTDAIKKRDLESSNHIDKNIPADQRYQTLLKCKDKNCAVDGEEMVTIRGDYWGDEPTLSCYPFNAADTQSLMINSGYGCLSYFHKGGCRTENPLHQVDILGACSPVPSKADGDADDWWSLIVYCAGGTKEWDPHGTPDISSITKRTDITISTASEADQRWIKYWVTGNDQCQTKADDFGVIYGGNMGDNYVESCQDRPPITDRVWLYVNEEHGCDLYAQMGSCSATSGFPFPISNEQCTELPYQNEGEVWSLKAVCGE